MSEIKSLDDISRLMFNCNLSAKQSKLVRHFHSYHSLIYLNMDQFFTENNVEDWSELVRGENLIHELTSKANSILVKFYNESRQVLIKFIQDQSDQFNVMKDNLMKGVELGNEGIIEETFKLFQKYGGY